MKRVVIWLVLALVVSGCTYNPDVVNDTQYIPYNENIGFLVNYQQPTIVLGNQLEVPLIADYRLYGDWLASFPSGDYKITFGEDNVAYLEDQAYADWAWISPNILVMNYYDGSGSTALRFDYIDDYTDFVQFTEYYNDGSYFPFLAVHVD